MAVQSDKASNPRSIDQQGRVRVPPEVMQKLKVGPGDHIVFFIEGDSVRVKRVEWVVKD